MYLPPGTVREPLTFRFTIGSDEDACMLESGHDAMLQVHQAGLSCVSLEYVEGKSSTSGGDTCAVSSKGRAQVDYSHPLLRWNYAYLIEPHRCAYVCLSRSRCTDKVASCPPGTTGPIYLVFAPFCQS